MHLPIKYQSIVTKEFVICRSILPQWKKHIKLQSDEGADFLGQILHQLGINCEGTHRVPSDMGIHIPPFTVNYRGRVLDSTLTLSILKLDHFPRDLREVELTKIMQEHGFKITFKA